MRSAASKQASKQHPPQQHASIPHTSLNTPPSLLLQVVDSLSNLLDLNVDNIQLAAGSWREQFTEALAMEDDAAPIAAALVWHQSCAASTPLLPLALLGNRSDPPKCFGDPLGEIFRPGTA